MRFKEHKFEENDPVIKPKGYPFPGVVVAVFKTRKDDVRFVVEHECGGLLHIFNGDQLENAPFDEPMHPYTDAKDRR